MTLEKQLAVLQSQNQQLRATIDQQQKEKEQQYVEDLKARNAQLQNENDALRAQARSRVSEPAAPKADVVPAEESRVKQVCMERDRALHQIRLLKEQLLEIEAFRLQQNRMFDAQERRIAGTPVMAPLKLQQTRRK